MIDYDFKKIFQESVQDDLNSLRKKIENGLISAQDAQKKMTDIANSGIIDQLDFGVNNFENGLIDSLINIGVSGEDIYNFIQKIFRGSTDKQVQFFNNLSKERKEQLAENPSFMREIGKEILPSMVVGGIFQGLPILNHVGKNIVSSVKEIPVVGSKIASALNPVGKLSDLALQSGVASALSGFEGEKTRDAITGGLTGAGASVLGSLGSTALEKIFPTKSPKGIANALLKEGKISKKEFESILKNAEKQFFELNPNLKNPLYKYDETKKNVLEQFLQNDIVDVNAIDATKNKIRKELYTKEFPKEFGDFFNNLLKESAEPATQSNYFANQYYKNVNRMPSNQAMQILTNLGFKDFLQNKSNK